MWPRDASGYLITHLQNELSKSRALTHEADRNRGAAHFPFGDQEGWAVTAASAARESQLGRSP